MKWPASTALSTISARSRPARSSGNREKSKDQVHRKGLRRARPAWAGIRSHASPRGLATSPQLNCGECGGDTPQLELTIGHFLRHIQKQAAVAFVDAAQQPAEHGQKTRFFARTAPGDFLCRPAFWQIGEFRRFFAVVKQLVKRHFQGTRHLFERFYGGNRMAIFYARNIAPKEPGTFFDVTLGELLFFAQSAQTIANNHLRIVS